MQYTDSVSIHVLTVVESMSENKIMCYKRPFILMQLLYCSKVYMWDIYNYKGQEIKDKREEAVA